MIRLLQNDPGGDEASFGGFVSGILQFLRMAWAIILGILLLGLGLAILVFAVMVISAIFSFFALFATDMPFLSR